MLTLDKLTNISGKKILVRVDFNVPIKDQTIEDDNRIIQALPTIKKLIKEEAKIILFSHLGKIDFKKDLNTINEQKKKNNMFIVFEYLKSLLKNVVFFADQACGVEIKNKINELKNGEILLLQNTRYELGETKNDYELSNFWASLADIYVMDAFGSAHRKHASTYGVAEIMKKSGKILAIGYLVEKEINNLNRCISINNSNRPYIAILGGLKVSDKIKVIDFFIDKCDKVIIGGAMAFTFQNVLNNKINYLVEGDQIEYAKKCLKKAGDKIVLPVDIVVTDKFDNWTDKKNVSVDAMPEGYFGMDIGIKTQELFAKEIAKAKTIFWNGPMGVFEKEGCQDGTIAICKAISNLNNDVFSVCGGGDSAAAVKKFGYKNIFSFISTGGGASLEMIENNGHLPCIDNLD
ncbi:MAG: phosphoglycerate kinase [Bacilli bacterium]|nr:phosphoglycerate kinase [Bacilli bacterium]